jgi:hypothetical protein
VLRVIGFPRIHNLVVWLNLKGFLIVECRGMPVGLDPQRTRHNHAVLIHAQSRDRRPAGWRQPLDSSCAIDPAKMLAPVLGAGIKQGHSFFRFRIWASSSGCFAEITRRTGEAQIFEIITATGINMLNIWSAWPIVA